MMDLLQDARGAALNRIQRRARVRPSSTQGEDAEEGLKGAAGGIFGRRAVILPKGKERLARSAPEQWGRGPQQLNLRLEHLELLGLRYFFHKKRGVHTLRLLDRLGSCPQVPSLHRPRFPTHSNAGGGAAPLRQGIPVLPPKRLTSLRDLLRCAASVVRMAVRELLLQPSCRATRGAEKGSRQRSAEQPAASVVGCPNRLRRAYIRSASRAREVAGVVRGLLLRPNRESELKVVLSELRLQQGARLFRKGTSRACVARAEGWEDCSTLCQQSSGPPNIILASRGQQEGDRDTFAPVASCEAWRERLSASSAAPFPVWVRERLRPRREGDPNGSSDISARNPGGRGT